MKLPIQFWALFEQIIYAFTSLAVMAIAARFLKLENFGILVTALSIWYLIEVIQRAFLLIPFVSLNPIPSENPMLATIWFSLNILLVGTTYLCLSVLARLPFLEPDLKTAITAASLLAPSYVLYFHSRRFLYHIGRVQAVFYYSILLFVTITSSLFFLMHAERDLSLGECIAILTCSHFFLGVLMQINCLREVNLVRTSFNLPKGYLKQMLQYGSGGLIAFFSNHGVQLIIGMAGYYSVAGIFAATRIISRPLSLFLYSIENVERSKAAQLYHASDAHELSADLRSISKQYSLILCPVLVFFFLFTPIIIELLLGANFRPYSMEARLWLVAFLPFAICIPFDIYYATLGKSKFLLHAKMKSGLLSLLGILSLYAIDSLSAKSAIIVIIVSRAVLALIYIMKTKQFVLES